jgi:hypothetical protein
MDIVYDRYISVKGIIMSLFFAFNLFVCINVMLPFLWNVRNIYAIRVSGLFAFLGFSTFCFQLTSLKKAKKIVIIAASALLFFLISEVGRPFIPPAPLRIEKVQFGKRLIKENTRLISPLRYLPEGDNKIYVLTTIKAPLGHREMVRHHWYLNGVRIYSSRSFKIIGQGIKGYRFWTYFTLKQVAAGSVLRVDLQTEAGQLIGRGRLRSKPNSS